MVISQETRRKIREKVGRRAYRHEGQVAEKLLKDGDIPVVIIGVMRNGDPVIAKVNELVELFNKEPLPKRSHRPNTLFGPR